MNVLRRIYSIYGTIIFFGTFLVLFPAFFLTIQIKPLRKYGRRLNRIWSKVFFGCLFIKVKFENLHYLKKGTQYIIVSNHFSYLDIPALGLIPADLVFVGKASLAKVPVFGYMFKNLHIAVDRNSIRSRGASMAQAKEAVDEGANLVIFPEGGINSPMPPLLANFKDGAFKIALDKQIPVIPITLSRNHLILPDDGRFLLRYKSAKVVIHEPIHIDITNPEMVGELRQKCFETIQNQLFADNPEALGVTLPGFNTHKQP